MTADLRLALSACRQALDRLEARLDSDEAAALPLANALVAVSGFTDRLDKLRDGLGTPAANGAPEKPRRRRR
jgi:hypothetical protein